MFFKESKTMKKIMLTLAAALIAVTSIFCFAGCGETPEQKLANYVASDECQKELNSMKSTYESMMDVDVRAEGKSLVYDLTYKTELPEESLDTVSQALNQLLNHCHQHMKALQTVLRNQSALTIRQLL